MGATWRPPFWETDSVYSQRKYYTKLIENVKTYLLIILIQYLILLILVWDLIVERKLKRP